ncbi:acetyl-CoA carboxylase, carboxyltransferase subunit beta [Amycolatopsis samaneae]|uniref:Multifunctional fusion protein n=1 Tax=Amycolatopsis samaneae TaxID=664691 RepID=A0ABW5GRL7_9PSEU
MTSLATRTEPVRAPHWELCPGCRAVLYRKRLDRDLRVCPDCGHHLRLTAPHRLKTLLDEGSAEPITVPVSEVDPLGFTDSMRYPLRRDAARSRTGLDQAVVCASGTVGGHPLVVAVLDFRFLGGSLGTAEGEAITVAGELALRRRVPLLLVTASGGARMQEGALSLMQMAKTAQMLQRLDEAGILTVSLITDPTFGGVAASFATLTDVIIAEPGARLGFAGPRVIEQTIRRPLPPGFQTAEFLAGHGLIDLLCPRAELRATLTKLLATTGPATFTAPAGPAVVTDPDLLPARDPWQAVRAARDLRRPTVQDHLARVFDEFLELHGDRLAKDCPAIVGGPALLAGSPVMVIGTRKGHTAAELTAHSFGMASPAGYRKAGRLMRTAAKLGIPVVTLIDTPGAHPGPEAETDGQAYAIAENLKLLAGLPVPVVAVVLGEGGSGGALALAVADRVLMNADAVYSVISPEGCAAILWHDPAAAPRAAAALRVDARQTLALGIADGVVPASPAGDHDAAAALLRAALTEALAELADVPGEELCARRRHRFRRFGAPAPAVAREVRS